VRITAQPILAESGAHIWTENYDRELTDVFAIQENIAQAIAGALRVPLGLQQGGTLIANRTDDLNSYEQYLRARALYRARTEDQGISILESLVARNPGFAPAWGLLSQAYVRGTRGQGDNLLAEKAAREAIRLDPGNAPAYAALADVDSFFGRWSAGEDGFRRALALDPNEPDILHRYSSRLAVAGRFKESFSLREKLNTLEPFVPNYNVATARFMISTGRVEDAIAIIERVPLDADRTTVGRNVQLARAYAITGRYAEAADTLLATPPQSSVNRRSIEEAARLLRTAPRKADSPEALPELEDNLNFVYAYVGALDRVLDDPERRVASRSAIGPSLDILWQPESAPLRKTERFKRFARDAGLVDYWKARGWPDLCRPVGADDFVCD
jgi:tetratricopeptide (TPR) repeat protein